MSYKVKIKQGLDELVKRYEPSVVVITAHPQNIQSAYSPGISAYKKHEKSLATPDYMLYRNFPETTLFRRSLYDKFSDLLSSLSPNDKGLVQLYLTQYSTAWVPDTGFDSHCILYTRW